MVSNVFISALLQPRTKRTTEHFHLHSSLHTEDFSSHEFSPTYRIDSHRTTPFNTQLGSGWNIQLPYLLHVSSMNVFHLTTRSRHQPWLYWTNNTLGQFFPRDSLRGWGTNIWNVMSITCPRSKGTRIKLTYLAQRHLLPRPSPWTSQLFQFQLVSLISLSYIWKILLLEKLKKYSSPFSNSCPKCRLKSNPMNADRNKAAISTIHTAFLLVIKKQSWSSIKSIHFLTNLLHVLRCPSKFD